MNTIAKHFDALAPIYDTGKKNNWYYYQSLKFLLTRLIPPGKKVLEVGCGTGDLLSSVRPKYGVGIDISKEMIYRAQMKYLKGKLKFYHSDITSFSSKGTLDYIFMADVIEHLSDVEMSLKAISLLMGKSTIFINTMANPSWEPILMLAEKLHLKMPEGPHNRISYEQIKLSLSRYGVLTLNHSYTTLLPYYIPLFTHLVNTHLEPFFTSYSFIEYFTAKKVRVRA